MGVPSPIDLFPGDTIKLCGAINYINSDCPSNDVIYIGLSYYTCGVKLCSTLIPADQIVFPEGQNEVCFSLGAGLNITLPACDTMFAVTIYTNQTEVCNRKIRFSYTLDIERYCPTFNPEPNLIARNCCEAIVTEVIPGGSLLVGQFYADDEGNCWEIIANTANPVDYTRNIANTYASCEACTTANPCPQNLIFTSCCAGEPETFTGSLPGITLGDSFVDTNGFCWYASAETSAPVTGLVTVDTLYDGEPCGFCTDINPCPEVFQLYPCCDIDAKELYVTAASLGYAISDGEVFVDTNGYCWRAKSMGTLSGLTVTAQILYLIFLMELMKIHVLLV